ncbi:MAG TPA: cobalamin-binding protein [Gemmatimonadaceae bacterium]|nr:cobalamin-binding protein [Gemmatimonadaceae bacterium]
MRRLVACAAGVPLLVATACTAPAERRTAIDIDDFGDTLALDSAPTRIVSLVPTTTEILFTIGAGDRLVGRSHWDHWPAAALRVPDVGDGMRPNLEAILAVRPDLVVLYAGEENRPAAQRLRAAGIPTLGLRIDRIAETQRAIRLLGLVTGDTTDARMLADSIDATLLAVRRATRGLPAPRVAWKVWDAPLMVIGGGSYLSELIEIAGGTNVYADSPEPSPQISLEDLLRRDPDLILAGPEGAGSLNRLPGWRALRAVRNGGVLVVDTALMGRPGVRLGEAAVSLAGLLHPELAPIR